MHLKRRDTLNKSGMVFFVVLLKTPLMKTLRLVMLVASLALLSYCGERRTTSNNEKDEKDAPGVGMAPDSANQKLDSTIRPRTPRPISQNKNLALPV
jgi:hypothetical protein